MSLRCRAEGIGHRVDLSLVGQGSFTVCGFLILATLLGCFFFDPLQTRAGPTIVGAPKAHCPQPDSVSAPVPGPTTVSAPETRCPRRDSAWRIRSRHPGAPMMP